MYPDPFSTTTPAAVGIKNPDCVKWRETFPSQEESAGRKNYAQQQSGCDPYHHLLSVAGTPWSTPDERALENKAWIHQLCLPPMSPSFTGYYSKVASSLNLLEWTIWDWNQKMLRPNLDVIHFRTFKSLASGFTKLQVIVGRR